MQTSTIRRERDITLAQHSARSHLGSGRGRQRKEKFMSDVFGKSVKRSWIHRSGTEVLANHRPPFATTVSPMSPGRTLIFVVTAGRLAS